MRQANTAIIRERHPIRTVDGVLHDLNQSKIFSKLDIELAFHQIELDEESRPITTFVTHKGLYRYKRHVFVWDKLCSGNVSACDTTGFARL